MQLPIIGLLILFTYSARSIINSRNKENKSNNLENEYNSQSSNSLILLIIGLLFNLFSVSNEVFVKLKLIVENKDLFQTIINFSKGLNSIFFLLASLLHFEKLFYRISIFYKTIIVVFCISSILLINVSTVYDFGFLPNVVDLLIFLLTTNFIIEKISIKPDRSQKVKINRLIFSGFIIWTFLQVLPSIGEILIRDEDTISLIGYSASAFAKCLILWGFYEFSIQIGKISQIQILKKNEELTINADKLNTLNSLLNEIASCSSNETTISTMIDHLIDSKIFGFDYAIFSNVDNLRGKIMHNKKHAKSKASSGLKDVSKYVREGGLALKHHDIMSQVVEKKKIFHVIKDYVDGIKTDFDKPNSILDKYIYQKYEHHKLDRLFIPVINNEIFKNNLDSNFEVIGILELGYNIFSDNYNENNLFENRNLLSIYLNNIAQTYIGNRYAEELQLIDELIDTFEKEVFYEKEYHIKFVSKVFEECAKTLEVNKGEFSLITYNNSTGLENILVYGDITGDELDSIHSKNFNLPEETRKKGIYNYVIEIKDSYFTKNVNSDKYYIPGLNDVSSQLSVPLKYDETVLGVMTLYSDKLEFFTERKKEFATRFISSSVNIFLRLKLSFSIRDLVIPYTIYDKNAIYSATVERLNRYYLRSSITIWETKVGQTDRYSSIYSNNKSIFNNLSYSANFSKEVQDLHEPFIKTLVSTKENSLLNDFEKLILNFGFCCIIYIPIGKNKGKNRFFTIASKRKIENLLPEDRTFFSHISNKFLLSITFYNVYSFIDSATQENYKRETEEILKEFLPKIRNISGADIALFFEYNENLYNRRIFRAYKPVGNLYDEKLLERLDSGVIEENDFSYSIVENGTQWIENEDEYLNYRIRQKPWEGRNTFIEDFWFREKVMSLAAIRIEFDGEILGVLFLNFREEIQLNIKNNDTIKKNIADDNRKLISLLSNVLGRIIGISHALEEDRNYLIKKSKESGIVARSEVAIGMIHNIKNILNDILSAYWLLNDTLNDTNLEHERLLKDAKRLGDLIIEAQTDYNVFKKYLMSSEPKFEYYQVSIFIKDLERIVKLYQSTNTKLRFIFSINETSGHKDDALNFNIYCDMVQITLIILNLIKNSIDANADEIYIRFIEKDSTNKYRVIEIQDNGIGIKDEDKIRIFDYSFTTKLNKGGSGMGLPVSKSIVETHGGRIDFFSELRKHKKSITKFSLYLPIK